MLGHGWREVITVKVETRPQRVLITPWRCHIAFGADHRGQQATARGGRQAGDLSANTLQRQLRARLETAHVSGSSQHRYRCAGHQALTVPRLPQAIGLAQRDHLLMHQQVNAGVLQLRLAQGRRMHPATFGIEQSTCRQRHPGNRLGFIARQ
ncbi:hypothetical protein D3C71_1662010 [compost metagenome]